MKIRNLTTEMKGLTLISLSNGNSFAVYVAPKGCMDIVDAYIPNIKNLDRDVFEIVGEDAPAKVETLNEESINEDIDNDDEMQEEETDNEENIIESDEDNLEESIDESGDDTPEIEGEKFICEICGAEFASSRGLNSHMKRVHPVE